MQTPTGIASRPSTSCRCSPTSSGCALRPPPSPADVDVKLLGSSKLLQPTGGCLRRRAACRRPQGSDKSVQTGPGGRAAAETQGRKPQNPDVGCVPRRQELVKRDMQDEFLDGGVLGVLKLWLEPMQDGSLPNIKVRGAILRVLLQLNFFFEDRKVRSQLRRLSLCHPR